jgi:hypothetical protein
VGRRCKKFNGDALAFIGGIAEKYDTAFLFFLRKWIGEDEYRVHLKRLVQIDQSAVSVDDHRLTRFAEPSIIGILSRNNHAHPHKDPGTASSFIIFGVWHDTSMLRHFDIAVNETVTGMLPQCNLRPK